MNRRSNPANMLFAVFTVVAFNQHSAAAAIVTTHEAEMDAVFSQESFGANPIDIRFLPTMVHVNPDFLNIQTDAEMQQLFALGASNPTVNFFYVDTISACGSTVSASIVGCGQLGGNKVAVESDFAAGDFGTELLSHELGHNLGLLHTPNDDAGSNDNLMGPILNGNTTLTEDQVSGGVQSIDQNSFFLFPGIQNPLVQEDPTGYYVTIQPILITSEAASVPEPSSLALLGISTLGLLAHRFRRVRGSTA